MKGTFISIGTVCALLLMYALFTSGSKTPITNQVVTQVYVPSSMTFAGESVPFDQDTKERLDRELTTNTYRHSATIRILKLSARYFPIIEEVLRANGVPDDFKYLAVAESGLENVSSPKSAKGYWQFLDSTGKSYGLEISSDVEERYHIEKSTLAACKYFKQAHERFGNWTMAAASYNMGMSGLSNRVSEQNENNYYQLHLNSETARYVYRILAFKQIMTSPSQYGFHFYHEDLYSPIATKTIAVTHIENIPRFSKEHGTTYKMIKKLNPWLKRTSLKAKTGKSYSIKVPL